MTRLGRSVLVTSLALGILVPPSASAWGWGAHRMINAAAVDLLPPDMRSQLESRRADIAAHAPDPDHWKGDPAERSRHYIDLELGDASGPPFAALPRDWDGAVAKLGEDSLRYMGVLPWRIESYYAGLVGSMRAPSDSMWIRLAAMGHYAADATMPLHTTTNYDGQQTGNRGIHYRFEWWMIEQHRDRIDLSPVAPLLVADPLSTAWKIIIESHVCIDTLLAADSDVRRTFREPIPNPDDRHGRGADAEFDARLFDRLGELAVRRIELAAQFTAGVWYAAWIEAGRPNLRGIPAPPPPPSEE